MIKMEQEWNVESGVQETVRLCVILRLRYLHSPLSTLHALYSSRFYATKNRTALAILFFVVRFYLLPLSYGMPSAFGALECLEVKARTTREMM